jgi:hypothetical protein
MLDDMNELENGEFEGYSEKQNWTHKNCIWELPYVKVLILPHNIDLIHQERNIARTIMSIYLDIIDFTKNNMNAGRDWITCMSMGSKVVQAF